MESARPQPEWTSSERKFLKDLSRTTDRTLDTLRVSAVVAIVVGLFMSLVTMWMQPGEQLTWTMRGTSWVMAIVGVVIFGFTKTLRNCKSILRKTGILPETGSNK